MHMDGKNSLPDWLKDVMPIIDSADTGEWMCPDYEPRLVSVILPTYNRCQAVVTAMNSVWRQTYRPIELLVVDDGSTDDTATVVKTWIAHHECDHSFRTFYLHQKHSGPSVARNLGLIKSTGEYLQFLDSDDVLYEKRFEKILAVFRQDEQCDSITSGFDIVCGNCGQVMGHYIPPPIENTLESVMLGKMRGNTWNFTDKRSLSVRIGPWDQAVIIVEDRDYNYRRVLCTENIRTVAEPLYGYTKGMESQLTDRLYKQEGWSQSFTVEKKFCEILQRRNDIRYDLKCNYVANLYWTGVRLYSEGNEQLGKAFGQLAENLGCTMLSSNGIWGQRLWRAGKYACKTWMFGRSMKLQLLGIWGRGTSKHICAS